MYAMRLTMRINVHARIGVPCGRVLIRKKWDTSPSLTAAIRAEQLKFPSGVAVRVQYEAGQTVRVMEGALDRELYSDPFLNQKVEEFLCGGL